MPVPGVDRSASAGDLVAVLVSELDLDVSVTEPQQEPGPLLGLGVQHHALRVKGPQVELC